MRDNYHISLEEVSIEEYEKILESKEILPGRRILKDNIHDRFKIMRSEGVKNLKELLEKLKTKRKIDEFACRTRLPEDYLLILKREILSYLPTPVNLKYFPGIDPDYIVEMADMGIKNSKQLFNRVLNRKELDELSKQTNIPQNKLIEILKLSDLENQRCWTCFCQNDL